MYKFIKFVGDKLFAVLGLIVLALPLLVIALAVKIESKGPAIFRQERIGKDQKPFKVFKFRTMKSTDVPFDINHPVIEDTNKNLTKVGRVIRKIKFDEFLQLLNVLKGDMSLVGPRPLLGVYLDHYEEWEKQKFNVKPGISGLAQVKGNGYLSPRERSYYDVTYTKKASFLLDIKILFQTLGVIFFGEKKLTRHVPEEEIEKLKQEYENTKSA